MKRKEIKGEVKRLNLIIKRKGQIISMLETMLGKLQNALMKNHEELWNVQEKCKHEFNHEKNPTVMGRGTCLVCGISDY